MPGNQTGLAYTYKLLQFAKGCVAHTLGTLKMLQQGDHSFFTYSGDGLQFGLQCFLATLVSVEGNPKAVRLISELLNNAQRLRLLI